tara:strand:- start:9788 stop:10933 length:1146 start_codon:yes stop_codon:yes gene_type:complete
MKIVHVVDYLMPDMGYQEFLLAQYNLLDGHEVFIITSNKYYPVPNYNDTWKKILGPREKKVKNYSYKKIKILQKKCIFEIRARPWINELENDLLKIKPDIIMVHGTFSFSALRVSLIKNKLNAKIILDNHMILAVTDKTILGKISYILFRALIRPVIEKNVDKILGVTKETCYYLKKFEGFKTKVSLLPLGVDTKTFYPLKIKKNKQQIILQSGKLNSDKKPQWLALAVLKILKEKKHNIKLAYVGNGDSKIIEDIKKMFKKNNFSANLQFIDYSNLKKLNILYNKSAICVFPEGTSLSSLQVAACKKPVIMANHPASKEKEKIGVGCTYKRGNLTDLSNKIVLILENKKLYKKICDSSYKAVIKNFCYSIISKKLINISK